MGYVQVNRKIVARFVGLAFVPGTLRISKDDDDPSAMSVSIEDSD